MGGCLEVREGSKAFYLCPLLRQDLNGEVAAQQRRKEPPIPAASKQLLGKELQDRKHEVGRELEHWICAHKTKTP